MTSPAPGDALVVAALAEEVAHIDGVEVLVTGVGKAVAAARLARRLADGPRPDLVINLGTAGAVDRSVRGIVEVEAVTQHDFPYVAIAALVDEPLPRGYVLSGDAPPVAVTELPAGALTVATGDVFVADPAHAGSIAGLGVHLVDMECFAYAATCAVFEVPMRAVKAVSDDADHEAGESWLDQIDACARSLADWVATHLR